MNDPNPNPTDLLEHAADWHARLRADDVDAGERAAFTQWLAQSDHHRLAYADVCAAALAVELGDVPARAAELPSVARARRPLGAWRGAALGALFGALAVLAVVAGPRAWQDARADFVAPKGATHDVTLDDGTRLVLDADSAIRWSASSRRELDLLRGAAWIEVAKDARPFVVRAGGREIRDVGTSFEARRGERRTTVAVAEGLVDVDGVRVAAGQSLEARDGEPPASPQAAPADAAAWRSGMLVFSATPFAEAIERLDARIPARVVLLASRAARDAPVTAIVPAAQARAAIDELARERGLSVSEWAGVLVVR